jgi:hypothetical protein
MLQFLTRPPGPPRLPDVSPETAAELARLLHPELIEVRGCVLLAWAYEPDNFEAWWNELKGDRARIEGVLNHIHLWDVFDIALGAEKLGELARVIADSWRASANLRFPDRSFEISVSNGDDDYGPTIHMQSTRSP